MRTKAWFLVILWILVCMFAAIPMPVQATAPAFLKFTADLQGNPDGVSAGGVFSAYGIVNETNQPASETYFIDLEEGTIHGVKTLTGTQGTITLKFQAVLTFFPNGTGEADGRFTIISGTGIYKNLHGNGVTKATINLMTGQILAEYTGKGHFD